MKLWPQEIDVMENDKVKIPPGLPPSDISRIQQSFRMLAPNGEQLALRFYDLLLLKFPDLQLFFRSTNLSRQHARFLNGLRTLVLNLENPQELRAALVQLGERHTSYGIEIQHYPPVVDTLLQVLTELGGEGMDVKTYEAWANFLHLIRAIMLEKHSPAVLSQAPDGMSRSSLISGNTKRILLIDDDHQILDIYHSYLEIQGYVCSQVSDVAWAFTHLQMSYYDLVLTDFQMPVMNGIQLRKNLDYLRNVVCPPFVLVTGSLSPEIRMQALDSGFVAVLEKPYDLTELSTIIHNSLEKS
jgi:CheY-like chemotaxis protein